MEEEEKTLTGERRKIRGKRNRYEGEGNTAVNDLSFVFGTDSECFLSRMSRD